MRGRAAGERGTVAIEAALIFPLLILLVFGIIEWSLVLKDQMELTSVARAGARTGSSLSPARPFVAPTPAMTRQVVDSLVSAASSLPRDTIDYVLV
ncbi:MAG: TadE family protein, partial [Candidatus Nanopelagicales bacterium]